VSDVGFGYWLAGLIDGEGSFEISRLNGRNGPVYRCRALVSLRSDDLPTLEYIQQQSELGRIYHHRTQRQSIWTVHRQTDLIRLIALLDKYKLRSKKRGDYAFWREAVLAWVSCAPGGPGNRAFNEPIWKQMGALKAQMEQARRYIT
jgi:LAGLIDADG endonuclease